MNSKWLSVIYFFILLSCQNNVCKQYFQKSNASKNIVILFHLYNLSLMDEFVVRINKFMELNASENFSIKICVPVAENVDSFDGLSDLEKSFGADKEVIYQHCVKAAPYHPKVITHKNCVRLFAITQYLKENLKMEPEKIHIIFSENRGVDVGSFLLLIDQLIKEKTPHDFLVKIHTKTHVKWREKLLKILDIKIRDLKPTTKCIYACDRSLSLKHPIPSERLCARQVFPLTKQVLNYFNLALPKEVSCSAGTMFIVSSELTNFFKKYDRIALYNKFSIGFPREHAPILEHGLEVAFGHIFKHLKLDTLILSNFLKDRIY